MRRVILQEFVSLDGLATGPNNSVDFIPASTARDRAFGREQVALFDTVDTILLGRRTYEMFAGYWPAVTDPDERVFADKMNTTPKVVVSKSLDRAPWGSWKEATIVRGDPNEEVRRLKQQAGKSIIVWGSISLAQSLINDKLVDEYQLVVCPLVLAGGRALFDASVQPFNVKLSDVKTLDRGAVLLKYVPAEGPAA